MTATNGWTVPAHLQPTPESVRFDLRSALDAVVALRAEVPDDAFTATVLGTERMGSAVAIRSDGLLLTIGYLITEAESIWLTANDGTAVPGHPLAVDFESGFGLVMPLGRLGVRALELGTSSRARIGDDTLVIGHGGRAHALKTRLILKREFSGYWEYVLDEALFTAPAHPHWSGTALLGEDGRLIGIGSLLVQEAFEGEAEPGNMFVPTDLLVPILEELLTLGRRTSPPRPWLGMYVAEEEGRLLVVGLAERGPASRAGVRRGDTVIEVSGERPAGLADLFRRVWRQGPAGTEIPLALGRKGTRVATRVRSGDRADFLKKPRLH